MDPAKRARLEKSWAHKMTDGGVGADGKLYFCGEVIRQSNGGALGWYDPATGEGGDGMFYPGSRLAASTMPTPVVSGTSSFVTRFTRSSTRNPRSSGWAYCEPIMKASNMADTAPSTR